MYSLNALGPRVVSLPTVRLAENIKPSPTSLSARVRPITRTQNGVMKMGPEFIGSVDTGENIIFALSSFSIAFWGLFFVYKTDTRDQSDHKPVAMPSA